MPARSNRQRRPRPRRKRYFVGCEGESEQGYAALIQRFAKDADLAVHLDTKVLSKAGDPLTIVEKAISAIARGESGSKSRYAGRFLFMDTDVVGQNPDRDARMVRIAAQNHLTIVYQDCCFEAVLLRHLTGHQNDAPPSADIALQRLLAVWPDYRKGLSAKELGKRLSLENVQYAARNRLNSDFERLLTAVGLLP